jgi:predicted metalloprotease with PDZ domain
MTASLPFRTLSAALALVLAGMAAAQTSAPAGSDAKRTELAELEQQMSQLGRRMAELGRELGETQRHIAIERIGGERPGLGVVLGENSGAGVRLSAVTPGGPADKAGLKSGDIVRSIDGRNLEGDGREAARALATSLRGKQNGEQVRVGYVRDGRSAAANVTLAPIGGMATFRWVGDGGLHRLQANELTLHTGEMTDAGHDARKHIEMTTSGADAGSLRMITPSRTGSVRVVTCMHGQDGCDRDLLTQAFRFRGLNLTRIDADLGRYFGADKGALLIAASDALPGLKSGDVITAVEGKAVESPREVMRALGDKDAGETLTLRILRNRAAQDVEVTVPEGRPLDFLPPPPPAPPAPPAPPVGAAPPAPPEPPAPPADVRLTVI